LTAFDRETLAPLNVLDQAGQVSGPNLILGHVELTRPAVSLDPAEVSMQFRLDAEAGPLNLAGVNLDRDQATPGDPMLITLFWQMPEPAETLPDLRAHLVLTDERGGDVESWDLPPVRADWPTTLWRVGDLWRGQHLLRLPAGLEDGAYIWQLNLYQPEVPASHVPDSPLTLGRLYVDAPERLWQAPPLQLPLDADLGGRVSLLGANLDPNPDTPLAPAETLTVTLVWQAQAEMEVSYRVFAHLLGPDGELLLQSDGEPADWSRPTTGWAPGEVVLDPRSLAIPAQALPGRYTLVAGLYDPLTKERLRRPDGSDHVLVTEIDVQAP
jgi:hypothetical protein